jgi:drug/metabolite transporter (DMT)-like permease
MELFGELASIGTSLAYSFGSVLFTFAGRSVGTSLLNRVRLALALLFTLLLHLALVGTFYPVNTPTDVVFWMASSGIVGYVIGDAFLFQGFVLVGPRLTMLVFSLAPVLSTIMAWVFLGEKLSLIEIAGIVITMAGIAIVVGEPPKTAQSATAHKDRRQYIIGLLCALGGAVGQAGGNLLSKIGLAGGLPAISGNAIRLTAAVILAWLLAIFQRQLVSSYQALRQQNRIILYIVIGTILGPVIGVWLALTAVQLAPLGIVTTLQSLPPIFLIPIGYVVFKERISRRAVLGTLVAIVGSVLLFF